MILTDREIKLALIQKMITIKPAPDEQAYSSTTVDLTLDEHLNEFLDGPKKGLKTSVDPMDKDFNPEETLKEVTAPHKIHAKNGYSLERGKLVLGWTREYIELPTFARIAARVEGKSSRARFGLGIHITAPTIQAGFRGRIRLEMVNHGSFPILLRHGMPICQLVFEQTLGTPEKGYQGVFLGQTIGEN